jgi:peptide/nickel transport system substrate-binding protein
MDKKSIIDAIYYGLQKPTETFLPTQSWAYNPDLPKQSYDPAKAKQILDAAGWKPGAGGIREKNGVKLAFTNSTTAGNHVREQAQELLQQTWREIGADMQIKNMPAAVILGRLLQHVQIRHGHDRPEPDDRPGPGRHDLLQQQGDHGEGRRRTEHHAVRQSEGGRTARARRDDPGTDASAFRSTMSCWGSSATICRCCRVFQYARIEGVKSGLIGYEPSVYVQSNCWNIGKWYWST